MKKILFSCFSLLAFITHAQKLSFWGIDVSLPHPEISNCQVSEIKDNSIFAKVKMSANAYTFANDKPNYSCWYSEETSCFQKASEYISAVAGAPLEVYTIDKGNTYTLKPSFFYIWKINQDKKNYSLLLFGSGEGMTLDVTLFPDEKTARAFILGTVRSFHFAVKPQLQHQLEE